MPPRILYYFSQATLYVMETIVPRNTKVAIYALPPKGPTVMTSTVDVLLDIRCHFSNITAEEPHCNITAILSR